MYEREQEEFIKFLNMTKEERMEYFGYYKQEDFADDKGLPHSNILSKWKANPKYKKRIQEAFLDDFKDILPAAKRTLAIRGIEDGDVGALKEIFKIAGVSIERVENVSNQDVQYVITSIIEVINEVLKDVPQLHQEVVKGLEEKLGEL